MKIKLNEGIDGFHTIQLKGQDIIISPNQVVEVEDTPVIQHYLQTNAVFVTQPVATYVPLFVEVKEDAAPTEETEAVGDTGNTQPDDSGPTGDLSGGDSAPIDGGQVDPNATVTKTKKGS